MQWLPYGSALIIGLANALVLSGGAGGSPHSLWGVARGKGRPSVVAIARPCTPAAWAVGLVHGANTMAGARQPPNLGVATAPPKDPYPRWAVQLWQQSCVVAKREPQKKERS